MIRITNLRKHFGDVQAVNGISLDIRRGEVFGFLGPNGAGKTTTIRMICGLLPASGGTVEFTDPLLKREGIKNHLGICPQENIFWPKLTCREQLVFMAEMYGSTARLARERADRLLEMLGLTGKAKALAANLSGGMKRRLNIALALVHDPQVLALDEPEAGLDPQSRLLVRNFIKGLAREKTVILTTHNMDEADRLADRVAIIDQGQLLKLDTPTNLKRSIGEGDLLEIAVDQAADEVAILAAIRPICQTVTCRDGRLILRAPHLVGLLPEITARLAGLGVPAREITLRENTLEDVFIHLTGRTLRV
ncbi:MAG: ABC transporter ATP-binding protein [Candidatus Neomarinimicrobiota bacterium]